MMQAVIALKGHQYVVAQGVRVTVDHVPGVVGDTVAIPEVLALFDDKDITIGSPMVSGASVAAKIFRQFRGDKVTTLKYRHKTRHRVKHGIKPFRTTLEIIDIKAKAS